MCHRFCAAMLVICTFVAHAEADCTSITDCAKCGRSTEPGVLYGTNPCAYCAATGCQQDTGQIARNCPGGWNDCPTCNATQVPHSDHAATGSCAAEDLTCSITCDDGYYCSKCNTEGEALSHGTRRGDESAHADIHCSHTSDIEVTQDGHIHDLKPILTWLRDDYTDPDGKQDLDQVCTEIPRYYCSCPTFSSDIQTYSLVGNVTTMNYGSEDDECTSKFRDYPDRSGGCKGCPFDGDWNMFGAEYMFAKKGTAEEHYRMDSRVWDTSSSPPACVLETPPPPPPPSSDDTDGPCPA